MKAKQSPWKRLGLLTVMIGPALLIAVGIVIYPIINTIIKSFQDSKTGAFTLANYQKLFTGKLYTASIWYTIWCVSLWIWISTDSSAALCTTSSLSSCGFPTLLSNVSTLWNFLVN